MGDAQGFALALGRAAGGGYFLSFICSKKDGDAPVRGSRAGGTPRRFVRFFQAPREKNFAIGRFIFAQTFLFYNSSLLAGSLEIRRRDRLWRFLFFV